MKYLKNVLIAASLAVSSLAFTSFSANAVLITQEVFIDLDTADAGNIWGITLADSGLFGTIQYDPTKVVDDGLGIVTPGSDPFYSFSFALGGLALSIFDDVGFGTSDDTPWSFVDPLNFFSGISSMDFIFFDGDGSIGGNVFDLVDWSQFDQTGDVFVVNGTLRFGDTTLVPEPSMLLLVLGGLAFAARRRFVA
jgi:hypothetical protein